MVRGCANYINLVPIPTCFLEVEEDEEFNSGNEALSLQFEVQIYLLAALSPDGKQVSQYVLWLAETIEVLGLSS